MLLQRLRLLTAVLALAPTTVYGDLVTVSGADTNLEFSTVSSTGKDWGYIPTSACTAGGFLWTDYPRASVSLTFTGSALSVYMAVCSLGGPTNVTIDGVTQVVNLYNSAYDCTSGQACDAKVVSVPDMAYGTHTVSVTDAAVAQEFSTSWSFFSKIEYTVPNGTVATTAPGASTTSNPFSIGSGTSGSGGGSSGTGTTSNGGVAGINTGSSNTGSSSNAGIIAGAVVGGIVVLIIIAFGLWRFCRTRPPSPPPMAMYQSPMQTGYAHTITPGYPGTPGYPTPMTPPGYPSPLVPHPPAAAPAPWSPNAQPAPNLGPADHLNGDAALYANPNSPWHANAAMMVQKARVQAAEEPKFSKPRPNARPPSR